MTPIPHDILEGFKYIEDAANRRIGLEPWYIDKEYKENGGHIYYAVDTDVVKLFSDPENLSQYTIFFSSDDLSIRRVLAWALGQYIFYRLTKEQPLLVIPPHHQEIESVLTGVALSTKKEYSETVDNTWPKLEEYFRKYEETNDIDWLIKKLKKEPLDLIRYVLLGSTDGKIAELTRLTELLRSSRILHIERFVEQKNGSPWSFPVLCDETDRRDDKTFCNLTKSWAERLSKTQSPKSQSKRRSLFFNDAMMLARLEWINKELSSDNKRLILVSGDKSIRRAANDYQVAGSHSFAELYIRDPRVFLAGHDFISPRPKNTNDDIKVGEHGLIEWLDVFLARFAPGFDDYCNRLKKDVLQINNKEKELLLQEFLSHFPDSINKLRNEWDKFIRLIGIEYGLDFDKDNIQQIAKIIATKGLDSIRKEVIKRVGEAWQGFWEVAVETGWYSTDALENKPGGALNNTDKTLPKRGVPAIRFTLKKARGQVEYICKTLEDITENKIPFDTLKEEDPSGYTGFLTYALAFGAACRWRVAHTLSELALFIADNVAEKYADSIPEGHEPITGNEAVYLLAWSIRHNAKTAKQLDCAFEYLNETRPRKSKATGKDGYDIRYESESIALNMTYQLFNIFKDEDIPDYVRSVKQCQKDAISLLTKLDKDQREEPYIKITIKKQLLAYLFCSFILRKYKINDPMKDSEEKEVLNWLPVYKDVLEIKGYCTITCFTKPVYLASYCKFGTDTFHKQDCKDLADTLFASERIQKCNLMPYDKELFLFLRNIIKDDDR